MATTSKVRKKVRSSPASSNGVVIPGPEDLNEPPDDLLQYCICLFGEKGVGKTSLAAEFEGALTLQLEPRRRNLRIRQISIPTKTVKQLDKENPDRTPWQMLGDTVDAAILDDTVQTIVLDTIDRVYESALIHRCYDQGISDPGAPNDYGATWRAIKTEFEDLMRKILYADKGLVVISHAKLRPVEVRGGDNYDILCPTCSPAAFDILKALCDYAFYYGYWGKDRALYLRGNELIWSACGVEDHFLDPEGTPLNTIPMGTSPAEAYRNLLAGWANKLYDIEHESQSSRPQRKKKS